MQTGREFPFSAQISRPLATASALRVFLLAEPPFMMTGTNSWLVKCNFKAVLLNHIYSWPFSTKIGVKSTTILFPVCSLLILIFPKTEDPSI